MKDLKPDEFILEITLGNVTYEEIKDYIRMLAKRIEYLESALAADQHDFNLFK